MKQMFSFFGYTLCVWTPVSAKINQLLLLHTTLIISIDAPKAGHRLTCQVAESLGSWAKSDPPHSWLMMELWIRPLDRDLGLSSQVR